LIWLPFLPGFLLWKLTIGSHPGKQYPCEKTGDLEPGRFKPIEEPGAEEKDPVVFTGLETVWVTVDKVGIPTFGLDGTQGPQDCRLSHLLPKAQA
jgi:hypothetical protein